MGLRGPPFNRGLLEVQSRPEDQIGRVVCHILFSRRPARREDPPQDGSGYETGGRSHDQRADKTKPTSPSITGVFGKARCACRNVIHDVLGARKRNVVARNGLQSDRSGAAESLRIREVRLDGFGGDFEEPSLVPARNLWSCLLFHYLRSW